MIPLCVDQGVASFHGAPWRAASLPVTVPRQGWGDDAKQVRRFRPRDELPGRGLRDRGPRSHGGEDIGKTMPQVALAWMLSKPYITSPIVGASKLPHLEAGRGVTFDGADRTRSGSWRNPTDRIACSGIVRPGEVSFREGGRRSAAVTGGTGAFSRRAAVTCSWQAASLSPSGRADARRRPSCGISCRGLLTHDHVPVFLVASRSLTNSSKPIELSLWKVSPFPRQRNTAYM